MQVSPQFQGRFTLYPSRNRGKDLEKARDLIRDVAQKGPDFMRREWNGCEEDVANRFDAAVQVKLNEAGYRYKYKPLKEKDNAREEQWVETMRWEDRKNPKPRTLEEDDLNP